MQKGKFKNGAKEQCRNGAIWENTKITHKAMKKLKEVYNIQKRIIRI